jgi:hypothetical protein
MGDQASSPCGVFENMPHPKRKNDQFCTGKVGNLSHLERLQLKTFSCREDGELARVLA